MSFTAPISRDGFLYDGDLYAEVGNLNRHKRASVTKLKALLRPDLVTNPNQTQDEVGHWYEAQCIHYGLPPSKTKSVAKVRLLNALNSGLLEVPRSIQRLEDEMRKEWNAAEKKAKAAYKATLSTKSSPGKKAAEASGSGKRKQTADGVNVNVNIDFGGFNQYMQLGESSTAYSQGPPPLERAKSTTPVAIKSEAQSWSSPLKNRETNYGVNYTLGLINGRYDIQCPRIAQEWGTQELFLILVMDTPRVWIRYDFGMFNGAMLLHERPYSVPQRIDFNWRGRDHDGEIIGMRPLDAGHIVFLGNGRIEGTLQRGGYGDYDFAGIRQPGNGTALIPKFEMLEEWNYYEAEYYG